MREYDRVITLGTGWEEVLEMYEVKWVIVREDAPLVKVLSDVSSWAIAYEDTTTAILVRK
jgi:hypothetical protein